MFLLLVVAGNETTRQAIAHGMQALVENPDEWARMRDDPGLAWQTGADEILRWSSPVLHFRRTATVDTEIRGRPIAAGDKVVVWYVSANFDEEVFDDRCASTRGGHRTDTSRSAAAGRTVPGRALAKLEVQILFEELFPRIRDLELTAAPERMRSNFTNALKRMPVRVTPA